MGAHRAPAKPRSRPRSRRRSTTARLSAVGGAVVAGLVVNGLMLWTATSAAFTASTTNPTNNWNAGSVALSDDDGGSTALFTASGLVPGSTGSRCITVTYGGDVTAPVKLFVSASSGTLGPYVNLTVEEGSGASFASCTGFSGSSIYSGTLSNFASTASAYGSGVGTWAPNASGQTRTYKFTYTLDASTPSSMQSTTASASFTWEAQA